MQKSKSKPIQSFRRPLAFSACVHIIALALLFAKTNSPSQAAIASDTQRTNITLQSKTLPIEINQTISSTEQVKPAADLIRKTIVKSTQALQKSVPIQTKAVSTVKDSFGVPSKTKVHKHEIDEKSDSHVDMIDAKVDTVDANLDRVDANVDMLHAENQHQTRSKDETEITRREITEQESTSQQTIAIKASVSNEESNRQLLTAQYEDTSLQKDLEWDLYKQQIFAMIEAQKTYPRRLVKLRKEGHVTIEFTLLDNGDLQDIKVLSKSGHNLFEKASLSAIKSIDKFPNFPETLRDNERSFTIALNYSLNN